jgi:hypothetical protein
MWYKRWNIKDVASLNNRIEKLRILNIFSKVNQKKYFIDKCLILDLKKKVKEVR